MDNLSKCSKDMKKMFERVRFWEHKIALDFPDFQIPDLYEIPYCDIYWQLKYLDHYCNKECYYICTNCFERTSCFNITHCCFCLC